MVVLPNGTSVGATRVTADPAYLDFTIVASTAQVQLASGLCAATQGSSSPVAVWEYTDLRSDVRGQATALDRAPAGAPIRYRVDVANAGTYALNSIAFAAPPSWGPATSWTCVGLNGATCPAATGTGNPAGPLALPASSTLRYEITALAPNPIVEGTVLARATAPAWTVRAATSVNDANLTWAGRYVDADGDGYGAEPMVFTAPGDDLVSIGGDCDDSDPTVVPGTAACCAQPTDCDDGDPCTEDVCTAGACSHSPTCSADAEPDAGAADSDPGTPPAEPTEAVASSDGCGCRVAGVPSPASSSLLALGLAGLVGLARIGARRRDGRP
ncbi:MAG: hypothetical protein BGO98_19285 [Myxococcales bacterium 68-20]|nr:hypothetical protein [Myxococcales bacterium]OJY24767.1 MAG: hypothetical protein BGO98_19285 [Myxococcales bacterium 68-20]